MKQHDQRGGRRSAATHDLLDRSALSMRWIPLDDGSGREERVLEDGSTQVRYREGSMGEQLLATASERSWLNQREGETAPPPYIPPHPDRSVLTLRARLFAYLVVAALLLAQLVRLGMIGVLRIVGVIALCRACGGRGAVDRVRKSGRVRGRAQCSACSGRGYRSKR